ncbi:hypothetical protein ACF0H5_018788 [Mactra antiquata]
MKPLLIGLLALIFVIGVAQSQYGTTSDGGGLGYLSILFFLIIILSLFGNQGTDFKVVFGNFSSTSTTTGRRK